MSSFVGAEPEWRAGARQLVGECEGVDAVECAVRRSQFEHLGALASLAAHRWGRDRDVWCFFGDDDDVAHPSRSAEYRFAIADAPRRCASVCAMWRAEARREAGAKQPRPRSAADVERQLAAGSVERVGEPYEYFHYALRLPALLSFLGAAPEALVAARFCDVAFVEFLRRTDRVVFSPRTGPFKRCWLYFYGGCEGPRASRSVPVDARAEAAAKDHVDAARRLSCGAALDRDSFARYVAHFHSRLEFFCARMVGGSLRRADAFLMLATDVIADLARLGLHKVPHLYLWCASRALHGLLSRARDFGVRLRPPPDDLLDAADRVADLTVHALVAVLAPNKAPPMRGAPKFGQDRVVLMQASVMRAAATRLLDVLPRVGDPDAPPGVHRVQAMVASCVGDALLKALVASDRGEEPQPRS